METKDWISWKTSAAIFHHWAEMWWCVSHSKFVVTEFLLETFSENSLHNENSLVLRLYLDYIWNQWHSQPKIFLGDQNVWF